jgi:hypothetical protein
MKKSVLMKMVAICLVAIMSLNPVTAFASSTSFTPNNQYVMGNEPQFMEIQPHILPFATLAAAAVNILGAGAKVKAGTGGLTWISANGLRTVTFSGTVGNVVARMTGATSNFGTRIWNIFIG